MKSTIFEKKKLLEEMKVEIFSEDDFRLDSKGNLVKRDTPKNQRHADPDEENNRTFSMSGYHNINSLKERSGDNVSKLRTLQDLQKSQVSLKEQNSLVVSTPKNEILGGVHFNHYANKYSLGDLSKSETIMKPVSSKEISNPSIKKAIKIKSEKDLLDLKGMGAKHFKN